MESAAFVITQARKWTGAPHNWMVNGWSSDELVTTLHPGQDRLDLPPGGWTLHAADRLLLRWSSDPLREGVYWVDHNQRRIHTGLWRPVPNRTVQDSWFVDGDLYVLHYRQWARGDKETGILPADLPTT